MKTLQSKIKEQLVFAFTYLDFTAPYLPSFCVFDSGLCIFDVVIQDKCHSFHSVKYNLRKTKGNRVSCCQKVNNKQR